MKPPPFKTQWQAYVSGLLCVLLALSASAQELDPDYTEFDIEDLLTVQIVTSVSKKPQKISDAPAAVFVITAADLQRSGVTSIADALRMVPGAQSAQINSHAWAVTTRGFASGFSNKLLVLVDGRSVYTPDFSGVYWDVLDMLLDDIERIEVVRGPGGTLWGANAVNGVINIITKKSADTQGGLLTVSSGSTLRLRSAMRYGGAFGENNHYRVYAQTTRRGELEETVVEDSWHLSQGGFRMDLNPRDGDRVLVQGDIYSGNEDDVNWQTLQAGETELRGGNLLSRWERDLQNESQLTVQAYYDYYEREMPAVSLTTHTADLDIQHRIPLGEKQELTWGMNFRLITSEIPATALTRFDPEKREDSLFSAFLQDEFKLIPDKLKFIIGAKFEHNDYSGFEFQPNARLLWTLDESRSIWASVSRAVRTPSRAEHTMFIEMPAGTVQLPPPYPPLEVPLVVRQVGNDELESEEVLAYEAGMRQQVTSKLFWDATVFYNRYENLVVGERTVIPEGTMPPDLRMIAQASAENNLAGHTYGAEVVADWIAQEGWRLKLAYTYLQLKLDDGNQISARNIENRSPEHQISLRSQYDINDNWQVDAWLRHVSKLDDPQPDSTLSSALDDYTTLDMRVAWQATKDLELALTGQNLLGDSHAEFTPETLNPLGGELEPSFYASLRWQF